MEKSCQFLVRHDPQPRTIWRERGKEKELSIVKSSSRQSSWLICISEGNSRCDVARVEDFRSETLVRDGKPHQHQEDCTLNIVE